ncbi:MAG: glycosyltransferase family 4 protein [Acidobacteriota bacterium]|nr:glycosyltransferase family 4 protein [Acidobacteriota bacterium]
MRIAYAITRADSVGGASIHVRDLARAMRGRGHEVLVLVGGEGPVTEQFSAANVPFRALRHLRRPVHPRRDLLAYREILAALEEFAPDLVSAHTAKAGWLGRAAAARLGLRAVYTPHGLPVGGRFRGPGSALFAAAERFASRWHAPIICVAEAERELALAARLAPPERLFVVHNGVRDVPPEFRAAADSDPVTVCCVARLAAPKDHATLLVALAALREREWTLELIGDGPEETNLRRLAARLGIAGRVVFRGYRPDPEAALAACQIFALSTRSEAFPRSVLEAMRAGLPVVATDTGGVAEAVEGGVTGLLVPPEDVGALTAALDSLIADAALRARLGQAGRRAYEEHFTLERTVERTLDVYRAIMDA